MADKTHLDDEGLEAFFEAARSSAPDPSPALLARVLKDAEDQQLAQKEPARQRRFAWAGFGNALGGWPALAGIATATVAGIWIGFSAPDTVNDLTAGYLSFSSDPQFADLMPTLDMFMTEG